MGWLEDAQKKLKEIEEKKSPFASDDIISLETQDEIEALKKSLRMEYINATSREIEKAIDTACEKLDKPYDKKEFMKFLRVKLED
jgi:hypothetical protein